MLDSARLMGFIPTTDYVRAKAFYVGILGLRLVAETEFALVLMSGAITVRVTKVSDFTPVGFTILGWQVEDIAAKVALLTSHGVEFQQYPWMEQDEAGIWTSPSGAKVAWFHDPDGNLLSLSSE